MKRKQIAAGVLSVFLLGTVIMPVHAEEQIDGRQTDVTYTQGSSWKVSIPKTILSQTEEVVQTVSATAMNIRPDKKLQVTIKSPLISEDGIELFVGGRLTLMRSDGATTTSVVSTTENSGSRITQDTVIAEFENQSTAFANNTTGKLYFSAVPANTKAGDYTGYILYEMKTVDK